MTNYRDFQPASTSRIRENIEWTITYAYNATDRITPRVLLIGDSIVNGYQNFVRDILTPDVNTTFWASSKCVTDPDYFRELDFILDSGNFDVICFNNGLHSLLTDKTEWEAAYSGAVKFISAKCPSSKLMAVLTTPHGYDNDTVIKMNEITKKIAEEENLAVIDLYSPMIGQVSTGMSDACHWKDDERRLQAEIVSDTVRSVLADK